jgi:hypothetical protein
VERRRADLKQVFISQALVVKEYNCSDDHAQAEQPHKRTKDDDRPCSLRSLV